MRMSASILRLTWTVVEEIPPNDLLTLSDTLLIKRLLQHIAQKILLSSEEICELYSYLGARVALIRDIAESRLNPEVYSREQNFAASSYSLSSI